MSDVELIITKLDGKLEKHIGITETILVNQKEILEEIRTEIHIQNKRFASSQEVTSMRESIEADMEVQVARCHTHIEDRIDSKVSASEKRTEKLVMVGVGIVSVIFTAIFMAFEIYATLNT